MKEDTIMNVLFEGYTDSIGNAGDNVMLSFKRTMAAREYIIKKGIDKERITTNGVGAGNSTASNETEEGRKKNRRVEIKIK